VRSGRLWVSQGQIRKELGGEDDAEEAMERAAQVAP